MQEFIDGLLIVVAILVVGILVMILPVDDNTKWFIFVGAMAVIAIAFKNSLK